LDPNGLASQSDRRDRDCDEERSAYDRSAGPLPQQIEPGVWLRDFYGADQHAEETQHAV
jgi:hypothetical protein